MKIPVPPLGTRVEQVPGLARAAAADLVAETIRFHPEVADDVHGIANQIEQFVQHAMHEIVTEQIENACMAAHAIGHCTPFPGRVAKAVQGTSNPYAPGTIEYRLFITSFESGLEHRSPAQVLLSLARPSRWFLPRIEGERP